MNLLIKLIDSLLFHDFLQDETPLFLAAREGNLRAIECLLQHGASKDITDQMDRQPRDIAEENNHRMVVKLLDKSPTPVV